MTIKEAMQYANITQQEVADKLQCSQALVSAVINGKKSDKKGIEDFIWGLAENSLTAKIEADKEKARIKRRVQKLVAQAMPAA